MSDDTDTGKVEAPRHARRHLDTLEMLGEGGIAEFLFAVTGISAIIGACNAHACPSLTDAAVHWSSPWNARTPLVELTWEGGKLLLKVGTFVPAGVLDATRGAIMDKEEALIERLIGFCALRGIDWEHEEYMVRTPAEIRAHRRATATA